MADYETIESRDLIPRSEKAQFWIKQLDLAGKIEKDWRQQGKEIVQRYRDEDRRAKTGRQILWWILFKVQYPMGKHRNYVTSHLWKHSYS